MWRTYLSGVVFAGLLAASQAGAQEDPSLDTVLATVGDTQITLGHAIALRATLPAQYDSVGAPDLFDLVVETLIRQATLAAGEDGELSGVARLRLDNERRAIIAEEVTERITGGVATDRAIRAYYDNAVAVAGDDPKTEYRAAHIVVETRVEAERLAARIADGENFAALAQEHSTGPSGPSGGNLGWFGEGVMVPAFFEAVKALEVGDVSDPVQTQYGWHLIKLNETRTQAVPEFDEVRDEIANFLRAQAVDAYLTEMRAEMEVEARGREAVSPEVINRVDLLEN